MAFEYLHTGADQMDLIQEGNVGLMQAIRKFDPTKNVRFYAYAAWWARAYILRYLLNNYRLVKVGTTQDQRKLFYNLRKEKAKLEREGFAPDTKLLADRLNVRERDVIEMDQRLGSWELSLDQPLTQDTDGTLLDVLPAQDIPVDEQLADLQLRSIFRAKLAQFAKTLSEREKESLGRLLTCSWRVLSVCYAFAEPAFPRSSRKKLRSHRLQGSSRHTHLQNISHNKEG